MSSPSPTAAVLQDFLYLDIDRVRALLAHLDGGVVERVVENAKQGAQGRAAAKIFGLFDLGGSLVRERASEQTKTLQDAVYLLFGEAALEAELFADVNFASPPAWGTGEVHASLREGQLIRCTAPARILDSRLVRERVDRFLEWMKIVADFTGNGQLPGKSSQKQRERALEQAMTEQLDGTSPHEIRRIGEFMELFLGGQISMRQFPCGAEHPAYALTGTLLDRPGYLQEEREALFAKYGSGLSVWTLVGQVATVPQPSDAAPEIAIFDEDADKIDRPQLEEIGAKLMELMEHVGVAEGPTYPAIPVTPLAVFREVPA